MRDAEFKNAIKTSIAGFHSRGLPKIFPRNEPIPSFKHVRKIVVVIGPRRAGKTFFLYEIMENLIMSGHELEEFLYLNFENERISGVKKNQLTMIQEAYNELYPNRKPIFFLDEIQNAPHWDQFVRRLQEEGHQVYLSGSNSKMLSKEIATSLRGHDYPVQILPFSFKEFIRAKGVILSKNWEFDGTKPKVKKLFDEYLNLSGYPEIVLENRLEFVDEYFKTMLFQDAVERYKVENVELLRLLMKYLTKLYAQEYSINKFNNFAKSNNYKSSTSVVQRYSKILEDIYFCFLVNAKQKSFKKETGYLKKMFLCDHAFINYYNTEKDTGRILENIVYLELVRRHETSINYYKNGFECDFITGQNIIQVCHSLTDDNKKRELNGILKAKTKFKNKKSFILTYDQEEQLQPGIQTVPIWKWLLNE